MLIGTMRLNLVKPTLCIRSLFPGIFGIILLWTDLAEASSGARPCVGSMSMELNALLAEGIREKDGVCVPPGIVGHAFEPRAWSKSRASELTTKKSLHPKMFMMTLKLDRVDSL